MNTETCGTGRSSGCPPVPCGVRAVPGGLHPCPCPGLMTATMTGFEAPVEPPRCRVLGICSPAPSLGVTAACPALGEALSGPGYAASGAAQLVCVGRWLGTRRGHSTTSLVPSRPQRLALPARAVQPARYPRKRACVHVYVPALSVVVSPGRAGTTRGSTSLCPDDGAPEMPSWDLGRCSIRRLPELSVVSCNVLFGGESLDFFPIFLQLWAG